MNIFQKEISTLGFQYKLKDSYSCYWKSCIFDDGKNSVNGNKLRVYRTVMVNFEREMHLLINDLPKSYISFFAKFRISAHSLEIEKGRHKRSCYQK